MLKTKEFFIETLRVLACILVVFYHSRYEVYSYVSNGGTISAFDNVCLNACFMLGRLAVPIFFIISGYFAFPVKYDTFSFLKTRLSRIFFPLIFWLLLYTLCFSTPNSYLHDIFYSVQAPQLWYLYAFIGITLLLPLVSQYFICAARNELLLYIGIWAVTLVFNGNNFDSFSTIITDHNGMLFTNPISGLLSFYGYFGYILIGHFFKKFEIKGLPFMIISSAILIAGIQKVVFKQDWNNIIAYCSLVNALVSSSVFLFVKNLLRGGVNEHVKSFVCKIGELSFGIYLVHWLVFKVLYIIPGTNSMNCLIISVIVFCGSSIITYLISLIPFKKYFIG